MGDTVAAPPPAAVHAAPSASIPAAAPPPLDDGISGMAWLKEMREMRRDAQHERELQTQAFVAALDKLGGKLDDNMGAMRAELRDHMQRGLVTVLHFIENRQKEPPP